MHHGEMNTRGDYGPLRRVHVDSLGDESIREKGHGYLVLGAADGVAFQRLRDLVGAARSRVCSQMIRFPTSLTCSDRPSFCRKLATGRSTLVMWSITTRVHGTFGVRRREVTTTVQNANHTRSFPNT